MALASTQFVVSVVLRRYFPARVPEAQIWHAQRLQPFFLSSNSPDRRFSACPASHSRRCLRHRLSMPQYKTDRSKSLDKSVGSSVSSTKTIWRRGWESNPRARFYQATRFRGGLFRPLRHLSAVSALRDYQRPPHSAIQPPRWHFASFRLANFSAGGAARIISIRHPPWLLDAFEHLTFR